MRDTTLGEAELVNLLDVPALQPLMDRFSQLSGAVVAILDTKGKVLLKSGWQEVCTQFHRVNAECARHCTESDLALAQSVKPGEHVAYHCRNGLWDVVTPLVIGGKHVGNIFTGQFFYEDDVTDEAAFAAQAERFGFDREAYLTALRRIPRVSREWVATLMDFLTKLSELISRSSFSNLKLAKALTQQKRIEAELRENEARLRLLGDNLPGGALYQLLMPPGGPPRYTYVSAGFEKIFGIPAARILADPAAFWALILEPDAQRLSAEQGRCIREMVPFDWEFRQRTMTGEVKWIHARATPRRLTNGSILWDGVASDITFRKLAEEERLRLVTAMEQAAETIVITDTQGTIVYANPVFEHSSGYTRQEALGQNPRILNSGKQGTAFYREMWGTLARGEVWQGHFINKRKDGTLYEENATISPVRNAAGTVVNYVAMKLDVTREKQLEAQFLRAQRLESIGALAGGIAHDLNNILAPILIITPLVRKSVADPENRALLDSMETSARRGTDIIKQLLTFARGKPDQRVPLPLLHLLRDMEKIVRETFPRDITARVTTALGLWPVLGDPTQIHQVLLNLCVNARDAMPEGGQLRLEAKNVEFDKAAAALPPEVQPGPYVCLSVTDAGTGMPPEILDRIFDPFFTTKEVGKGTGLGLSTVLGVVRGHKGFIQVNSEVGRGTTFELFFPASPEVEAPHTENQDRVIPRGQGQLILVVEDEAAVLGGLRRVLEAHSYRVAVASQGAEGLTIFNERHPEIAAVVTDLMMPTMGGAAMIKAMRALAPSVPVVVMSGLTDQQSWDSLKQLDATLLLTKPFSAESVLEALAQLLRGKHTSASETAK